MAEANPPTDPGGGQIATDPVEGQRAWIAQLDRKLGTRTYAGAALLVLSLAAAIVGVVIAMDARDNSAAKGDLQRLEQQLAGVQDQASAAEETQASIDSLTGRVDEAEAQLDQAGTTDDELEKRIEIVENDIEDLRNQISDLGSSGSTTPDGTPSDE